jgi:transposase
MAELQDVVQRLRLGHGVREIARSTGVHRSIIRSLAGIAKAQGWLTPESELPSEEQIQRTRRVERSETLIAERLAGMHEQISAWLQEGYSGVVIHELVCERIPCSAATVRRYLVRHFPQEVRLVAHRPTEPGKVMEVDFGYLGVTYDPDSGRKRKTWLFSGRLRHSRLAWRERVFDQKEQTFFRCHMNAFEYFEGVPERVTPDNLKAAVVKASFTDPVINRAYRSLAEHYRFLIDPCLPGKPEHKGGVENDIKYVKGNCWPLFRERQRQKGREVPYADELEQELERWTAEVSETRIIKGMGRSPREIFETEEARALKPMPAGRWDPVSWGTPKVGEDWRVQFERGFYSVPYAHVGKQALVYGNRSSVRIFVDDAEVALHARVDRPWGVSSKPEHAPPHKEQWLSVTREGLLARARELGEAVGALVQTVFADRAVDGMRSVRALLSFEHRYSAQRLEAACARALQYGTPCYRSVKEILAKGLDKHEHARTYRNFRFQRAAGYFDPRNHSN